MTNPGELRPEDAPQLVKDLVASVGGTIDSVGCCPDGSGFATMSMPLPPDHWSTKDPEVFGVPPMPIRMGADERLTLRIGESRVINALSKPEVADIIREVGKYAYRASTMNGKEPDLDPDALLQNLVVGFLGYWTDTGLSSDEWANPPGDAAMKNDEYKTEGGPGLPGPTAPESFYKSLHPRYANPLSELLRAINDGICTLAGPGRGDCEHFVGLPGYSIPGQHDGPDDTVDAYGKPNGWCWSCWKSYRLMQAQARIQELEGRLQGAEE